MGWCVIDWRWRICKLSREPFRTVPNALLASVTGIANALPQIVLLSHGAEESEQELFGADREEAIVYAYR